jgi:DNA-binding PadR family transcriptional regulator
VSLKYAMLGFIDMMPLSGFDLKKMFDSSINNYWTATHAQIYRTLVQMEKNNLIEIELIIQSNAPNKKNTTSLTEGRMNSKSG